jgi:serine/threonine protein phosphatase PrpC
MDDEKNMGDLKYFGHSDIGSRREMNEDSYLCLDLPAPTQSPDTSAALLAVADGIGGHAGGAVASGLATEALKAFFTLRLKDEAGCPSWPALLGEAFQLANDKIFERIIQDRNLIGMGTTMVAAVVAGGRAFLANVGDSRAYLVRRKEIGQITRDHSWVAEQKRLKVMSEDEVNHSPFRHMITRSLGSESQPRVDFFELDLEAGDFLLLCSDGLYVALSDKEILKAFKKNHDPEEVGRKLLGAANQAGSRDNITAVVARVGGRETAAAGPPSAKVKPGERLIFPGENGKKGCKA